MGLTPSHGYVPGHFCSSFPNITHASCPNWLWWCEERNILPEWNRKHPQPPQGHAIWCKIHGLDHHCWPTRPLGTALQGSGRSKKEIFSSRKENEPHVLPQSPPKQDKVDREGPGLWLSCIVTLTSAVLHEERWSSRGPDSLLELCSPRPGWMEVLGSSDLAVMYNSTWELDCLGN